MEVSRCGSGYVYLPPSVLSYDGRNSCPCQHACVYAKQLYICASRQYICCATKTNRGRGRGSGHDTHRVTSLLDDIRLCIVQAAIARGLAYAPFADLLWVETSTPDLAEAREFAEAIQAKFPGKMLAYNCSPSFNWRRHLDEATIAAFQKVRASLCAAAAPEHGGPCLISSYPILSCVTVLIHCKQLGSLETRAAPSNLLLGVRIKTRPSLLLTVPRMLKILVCQIAVIDSKAEV